MAEEIDRDSTLNIPVGATMAKESDRKSGSLVESLALRLRKAAFAYGGLAVVAMVVGGIELEGVLFRPSSAYAANQATSGTSTPAAPDALDIMQQTVQARSLTQKKKYDEAERMYRSILKTDASNVEVQRLLASALFRNGKIDECIEVLNSLSGKPASSQEIDAQQ